MIGYTMPGTNRLEEAVAFYGALFEEMGASRFLETDSFVTWSRGKGQGAFAITKPFDGNKLNVFTVIGS